MIDNSAPSQTTARVFQTPSRVRSSLPRGVKSAASRVSDERLSESGNGIDSGVRMREENINQRDLECVYFAVAKNFDINKEFFFFFYKDEQKQ